MSETIRTRAEIPAKYKWNAESVFASDDAWNAAADELLVKLNELTKLAGKVGESAASIANALDARYALFEEAGKVIVYAAIAQAVDNADDSGNRMLGKMQSVVGQVFAGVSFIEPELLQIEANTLAKWRKSEPRLKIYDQFFDDLLRQQAHVRSAEVEEVFGLAQDPIGGLYTTMNMMTNSEMKYPNAITTDGKELTVTQGTLDKILASPDREARRATE